MALREVNGRFSRVAARAWSRAEVAAIYERYLAGVVKYQGLDRKQVDALLARPGELNFDIEWRKASYARQLAMYLTHVVAGAPQTRIAEVTGIDKSAVCKAQGEIENLRDHHDYNTLCDLVAAEFSASQVPA